jgi:hypothetical protein
MNSEARPVLPQTCPRQVVVHLVRQNCGSLLEHLGSCAWRLFFFEGGLRRLKAAALLLIFILFSHGCPQDEACFG